MTTTTLTWLQSLESNVDTLSTQLGAILKQIENAELARVEKLAATAPDYTLAELACSAKTLQERLSATARDAVDQLRIADAAVQASAASMPAGSH